MKISNIYWIAPSIRAQLGKTAVAAQGTVGVAALLCPGLVPAWQRTAGSVRHARVLDASCDP